MRLLQETATTKHSLGKFVNKDFKKAFNVKDIKKNKNFKDLTRGRHGEDGRGPVFHLTFR